MCRCLSKKYIHYISLWSTGLPAGPKPSQSDVAGPSATTPAGQDPGVAFLGTVKLPEFWPDNTDLWFARADAQFRLKKVTAEQTKFDHVITMLDSKTAAQVMDILVTPPDLPYSVLKTRLTKTFALTTSEKASWILDMDGTVHALSHPGARLTKRLVSAKFVWHGLGKQITHWARSCLSCQRAKVQTHVKAPIQQFQPAAKRFDHVHIDLVGPLPESKGFKYLLTVVDRFTRWPEAIPIRDIETRTIALAYAQHWVASFGVPTLMTSDRGPQFVSDLWTALSSLLGTSLHPTTAYHPQANGLVERMHRTLKGSLKARLRAQTGSKSFRGSCLV